MLGPGRVVLLPARPTPALPPREFFVQAVLLRFSDLTQKGSDSEFDSGALRWEKSLSTRLLVFYFRAYLNLDFFQSSVKILPSNGHALREPPPNARYRLTICSSCEVFGRKGWTYETVSKPFFPLRSGAFPDGEGF